MPVWRLWLVAFLVVLVPGQLAVGMRASTTATVTGDEPFYLLTAQSLVSEGDLDLRDEYRHPVTEIRRFWDGTKPLWKQMEPAPDGRLLSPHDPGLSLLITPAYAAGGLEGVRRLLVVVWAAAMGFAALLARRAGAPDWASLLGAAAVGAGVPGLVYASQVYPEGPAALCIAVGLLAALGGPRGASEERLGGFGGAFAERVGARGAFRARVPERERSASAEAEPGRSAGSADGLRTAAVVAAVVALEWLGVKYLPYAVLIVGLWAWRNRRRGSHLVAVALVGVVAGAHFVWWHLETFGALTPYTSNVVWAGEGTSSILRDHLSLPYRSYRLYGLFLDARFGLLRWLPVVVIAVLGIRRRTWPFATTLAIAVVLGTFVSITMMGYWFPGRMLVAAFPALVVLVAVGATRLPRTTATLAAWGWVIAAAVAVAAKSRVIRLAVDPWVVGFPLPPAALFPDFREFAAEEITKSLAWALAAIALIAVTARKGTGGAGADGRAERTGGAGALWRVARREGSRTGRDPRSGRVPCVGGTLRDRTRQSVEAGSPPPPAGGGGPASDTDGEPAVTPAP